MPESVRTPGPRAGRKQTTLPGAGAKPRAAEILKQTGCYKVERYCDKDMAEFTNMYLQRMGHKHCNNERLTPEAWSLSSHCFGLVGTKAARSTHRR